MFLPVFSFSSLLLCYLMLSLNFLVFFLVFVMGETTHQLTPFSKVLYPKHNSPGGACWVTHEPRVERDEHPLTTCNYKLHLMHDSHAKTTSKWESTLKWYCVRKDPFLVGYGHSNKVIAWTAQTTEIHLFTLVLKAKWFKTHMPLWPASGRNPPAFYRPFGFL